MCKECKKKQKIINTLQKTCASYETRIKRFQTLSKNRSRNRIKKEIKNISPPEPEKWMYTMGQAGIDNWP